MSLERKNGMLGVDHQHGRSKLALARSCSNVAVWAYRLVFKLPVFTDVPEVAAKAGCVVVAANHSAFAHFPKGLKEFSRVCIQGGSLKVRSYQVA
jgi:hypothetical protein